MFSSVPSKLAYFFASSTVKMCIRDRNDSDRILGVFDDKVDNGEVLSGSTPLGYTTVSYTHLDVYKRQLLLCEFLFLCLCTFDVDFTLCIL